MHEHGPIGQHQLEVLWTICLQLHTRLESALEHEHLLLAHLELHPDLVERDDRRERLGRVRRHECANVQFRITDSSADRRRDRGVVEIELGAVKSRLAGGNIGVSSLDTDFCRKTLLVDVRLLGVVCRLHRSLVLHGVVEVLFGRSLLLDKRPKAIDIVLCANEVRFGLGELRLCLDQFNLLLGKGQIRVAVRNASLCLQDLGLIRTTVENIEDLPLLHLRAGVEEPLLDIARHATANLDLLPRKRLSDKVAEDRHVTGLDLDHLDADRGRSRRRALGTSARKCGTKRCPNHNDRQTSDDGRWPATVSRIPGHWKTSRRLIGEYEWLPRADGDAVPTRIQPRTWGIAAKSSHPCARISRAVFYRTQST